MKPMTQEHIIWQIFFIISPFSLIAEEPAKEEQNTLIVAVDKLEINEWFDARMLEFKNRFPEFQ